ncbi:beta-propeller fold lactonase family protein [Streptomyces sp. NPDC001404]|uniref:beta-propeller fold lactonase family protein n=1 Tax=Streptomyces sp. NPDC001404 TaxID=3364571 RepID=UPI0036B2F1F6
MNEPDNDHGSAAARLAAPVWGADDLVVADLTAPEHPEVHVTPVESNPRAIAVSSDGTRAYTADHDVGTLSVVDLGQSVTPVLRSVPAGKNPCAVVAGLAGDRVCVADWAGNQVAVLDKEGISPALFVPVGAGPCALAAAPGGQARYVCVVNETDATVSVVDVNAAGSPSVTATVPVPGLTRAIAVAGGGRFAYVASRGAGTGGGRVTVLDLDAEGASVGEPVPVGAEPRALTLSADGRLLCVTAYGSASVSVASVDPVIGRIGAPTPVPVEPHPVAVAFTPDGSRILAVSQTSGRLTAIRTDTLAPTTLDEPVGAVPCGVVPGPDGRFVYVSDQATGTLVTVRTAPRRTGDVGTGAGSRPVNVAVSSDGSWAYAADAASDKVAVLDLGSLTPGTPIPLGGGHAPWDVAVARDRTFGCATSPGTAALLVLTPAQGDVLTVGGAVTVTAVPLAQGADPHGVAITPDGQYAVTADSGTATVSLVDPKGGTYTIAADVVGCQQPTGAALSKDGTTLYVSDFARTQPGQRGGQIAVLTRTGPGTWQRQTVVDAEAGHLSGPHELAVSADGLRLCVTNYQDGTVSVLGRATTSDPWGFRTAVTMSPPMRYPYGLALTPDGETLYVSNAAGGNATVEVFDISASPATRQRTIKVEDGIPIPPGLALSPDGQYLYAAVSKAWAPDGTALGTVYGIQLAGGGNTMTAVATAPAAYTDRPNGLACQDNQTLYVVNQGRKDTPARNACLAVITLDASRLRVQKTEQQALDKDDVPYSIAVAEDGTCCVANSGSGTVTVFTSKVTPVKVGEPATSRPWDVDVTDDGVYACVSDREAATVHRVRLADHTVIPVPVGPDPMGVACAPGGARAYAANHGDDSIAVINLNGAGGRPEVIATWRHALIVKPESVSVSADGTWLFVTTENSGAVLMLDTTTGTPRFTVPAGQALAASAPDPRPATPLVYLADTTGAVVSVVNTTALGRVGATAAALDVRQAVVVPAAARTEADR